MFVLAMFDQEEYPFFSLIKFQEIKVLSLISLLALTSVVVVVVVAADVVAKAENFAQLLMWHL